MSEYFDVFFHQQLLTLDSGTVLFNKETSEDFLVLCERKYEQITDENLSEWEKKNLLEQFSLIVSRKYIEIQFFDVQLDVDVLLEELAELFPQFIWTKVIEIREERFSNYYCEFAPLVFDNGVRAVEINLFESLKQMNISNDQTISELVEERLALILTEEDQKEETLMYPVNVSIKKSKPKKKSNEKKVTKKRKKKPVKKSVKTDLTNINEEQQLVKRSEKSEILFLKESLKQEQNSKQRMKIIKDKLEEDLLAAENAMLKSSINQYKKINRQELQEEEWYKSIRIDYVRYDEICKKAKFLKKIWNLNKELVEVFNSVQNAQNSDYDQERVAKIKRKVSETKMLTWLEQSKRIFERAKVRQGILFIKPSVKLYKVDFEQLERMSALFDIIQAENSFLERVLDDEKIS